VFCALSATAFLEGRSSSLVILACVFTAITKKGFNFLEEKRAPPEKIRAMPIKLTTPRKNPANHANKPD